jgi:hypothetical protein
MMTGITSESADPVIAEILLDGYYSGVAASVAIRFGHRDQELMDPELEKQADFLALSSIWDVRGPLAQVFFGSMPIPTSVERTAAIIDEYVRFCSSPEARALDESAHLKVGGRTHVATISRDGFEWVHGYEPRP